MAQVFNDSKTFVDMPMRVPPSEILSHFASLPTNASVAELTAFVEQYFYPAGAELYTVIPEDYRPSPEFLYRIANPLLREWGLSVHEKWQDLMRNFNHSFSCEDCFSSILVPNPFVVAGGRFREYYYWDSYWTMKGLLVSNLTTSALWTIQNFCSLIDRFGFIPNGGRIYYTGRSQPPLLTQMVYEYYNWTGNLEVVEYALPFLVAEHAYWMANQSYSFGAGRYLNVYSVYQPVPRPEAYYEDVLTASGLPEDERSILFSNIASTAETGWDFSSRWFLDYENKSECTTKNLVPVDLNSIMYLNEITIGQFFTLLGNETEGRAWTKRAQDRSELMDKVLFDVDLSQWLDYDTSTSSPRQAQTPYVSNFSPLWAGAFTATLDKEQSNKIVEAMKELLGYPAGVPASLVNTTQQWDFPNAWSPLQYFMISALERLPLANTSTLLARQLIQDWVNTNWCAWNETGGTSGGIMFEKYDCLDIGAPGGGGEYSVQQGFGWTNGVALWLLYQYGDSLEVGACPPPSYDVEYYKQQQYAY